jgi:hypothetical protein
MLAPFCISLGLFLSLQKHLAVRVIFNNLGRLSYVHEEVMKIFVKIGPISIDVSSSNISRKVNLYFSMGHYF